MIVSFGRRPKILFKTLLGSCSGGLLAFEIRGLSLLIVIPGISENSIDNR